MKDQNYSFQDKMNSGEPDKLIFKGEPTMTRVEALFYLNRKGGRKVLELDGEEGSIVYEELILEGKTFYTQKTSETSFVLNKENPKSAYPLYFSFKEAMEHSAIDIFMLTPVYIDPEIWNELSEMFVNYCDEKDIDMFLKSDWTKALGISDSSELIGDIEGLGLSSEEAMQLCDIICKIQMNKKLEEELEEILEDSFLHEGGGPGTRELLIMLAKQVQG